VPERRTSKRAKRSSKKAGVVSVALGLCRKAAERPVDSAATLGAIAGCLIIVVNALFLQSGPHPAPFFANPVAMAQDLHPNVSASDTRVTAPTDNRSIVAALPTPRPAEAPSARPTSGTKATQTATARRGDPIGDLIGSIGATAARIAAVQRVLSEFAYGPVKPTGVVDQPTSAAIARFESEHKMPVTGRLSDQLLRELATLAGHPIE
jgi:hypothetical protein